MTWRIASGIRPLLAAAVALVCVGATTQPLPADLSRVQLRVGFLRDGSYAVETLPLEVYVSRVLAGEAARDSAPAALEALAITIRTFALANRGRHRADGFDLCDQTHCQVVRNSTAATDRAATVSAGRVLMHASTLAAIYYTASCGGRTEIPSAVWPDAEDPPYLPSKRDDACGGTPVWSADLPSADLERALVRGGYRGRLRDLRIAGRDGSGRVARLRLDGMTPDEISGQDLRVIVGRTLGWLLVKSTAFDLREEGRGASAIYRFSGHGSGHGVGLCVIGSARLAAEGASADAILARYFPGTTIETPGPAFVAARRDPGGVSAAAAPRAPAASPEVLLTLPDDDEGERALITTMALAARDDLARALDVAAPRTVTIRFHPTIDDYSKATAQPWFTSGAIVGGELHLVPLTVLRERGLLERTIRHELVHLLADEALASRPMWVQEGAAIHFAGDGEAPDGRSDKRTKPSPRGGCPADNELREPVSAGALANAYARARICFERQLGSGKSWRDVK